MTAILILNGPNLNLLGTRQPDVYGTTTLQDIEAMCVSHGKNIGLTVSCAQSNHEGALIDHIHRARGTVDGIILNAGAFTHTSIAIMDAVASIDMPVIEVHLSNIHAREAFRHKSYLSQVAIAMICGFGAQGYVMALDGMKARMAVEE